MRTAEGTFSPAGLAAAHRRLGHGVDVNTRRSADRRYAYEPPPHPNRWSMFAARRSGSAGLQAPALAGTGARRRGPDLLATRSACQILTLRETPKRASPSSTNLLMVPMSLGCLVRTDGIGVAGADGLGDDRDRSARLRRLRADAGAEGTRYVATRPTCGTPAPCPPCARIWAATEEILLSSSATTGRIAPCAKPALSPESPPPWYRRARLPSPTRARRYRGYEIFRAHLRPAPRQSARPSWCCTPSRSARSRNITGRG